MENTKTPRMHRRLGSTTLSQLAFPGENDPKCPWKKSEWDNTVVKKKKKKKKIQKKKKRKTGKPDRTELLRRRHQSQRKEPIVDTSDS